MTCLQQVVFAGFCGATLCLQANTSSPVKLTDARASSVHAQHAALMAIDGDPSEASRWTSGPTNEDSWIEVRLDGEHPLAGIHLQTGINTATALRAFRVQFWNDHEWKDIPSSIVADNRAQAVALAFDDAVRVRTDRLRILITATSDGTAHIREIVVWPSSVGTVPPVSLVTKSESREPTQSIYLNQSGFNAGKPKRFTAPHVGESAEFRVVPAKGGPAVFVGTIAQGMGDFSSFEPQDSREYVVEVNGEKSVPFRIGPWWFERVSYQNALNFMIDARHHVGNHRATSRLSYSWRDDHHFSWELHTLVAMYLANPSAFERMPGQISYEASKDSKLWGALEPYRDDVPDLVKLIHWGADVIVSQKLSHELMKTQLAYFLHAWPALSRYLPAQNYAVVRDFAFASWAAAGCDQKYPYDESPEHNLLTLKSKVGTTKGAYPPGFSIQPNLLMYEVAIREGHPDAAKFLDAARQQAEWIVHHVDWNDPLTTKGQRMSEFVTMSGLTHMMRDFPEQSPTGLRAKIEEWIAVAIRRSNNLWDFRKLDDHAGWAPTGPQRTMWNEPGNVLGFPGILAMALPYAPSAESRQRLQQMIYSHIDNSFGRNPTGRHFSYDAPREIEGVEEGWYSFHQGGIGQLADARFVFDGSPKNQHYPFNPAAGNVGWTEGWVAFNSAFNNTLAYLAFAETALEARVEGDELVVRLSAPLNFDYEKIESGAVYVVAAGDEERVEVTEDSTNSRWFSGRLKIHRGAKAQPQNGVIEVPPASPASVRYGHGYLAVQTQIIP